MREFVGIQLSFPFWNIGMLGPCLGLVAVEGSTSAFFPRENRLRTEVCVTAKELAFWFPKNNTLLSALLVSVNAVSYPEGEPARAVGSPGRREVYGGNRP